jgi:glycosyltransferase involved in cell wall biosynthesis
MNSTIPWLSVIVPVYNGDRYLGAALESVLAQVDASVEIIVTDDGSTDGSADIIDAYARRGAIIPLAGPCRGNWAANSNFGVGHSRGRFVTFLHQDDLWLAGRLESIRRTTQSLPDRSLWIGPTHFIDSAGRQVGTWRLPFGSATTRVEPQDFLQHLLVQNFVGMPAPVFPREAFDRAGGMDEGLWFTADWDLWIKLGIQSGVGVSADATTSFRLHRKSQTMTGAAAHESMRAQIEAVRSRYLPRIASKKTRESVDRAGRFSSELNDSLARLFARQPVRWHRLLASFFGLGIDGLKRYLRDARLGERSIARIRVALGPNNE